MKTLLLSLISLVLLGCDGEKPDTSKKVQTQWGPNANLTTVTHDGHKIILGSTDSSSGGVSMMHHPGCECLKVSR